MLLHVYDQATGNDARFSAGPPIVGGGAVWTFDQDSGTLLAFDPRPAGR